MKFNYETQGAITYLVCELDPVEQVDTLTLGMLTNNHIAGLAPVLYTEMNGQRFLKYNISAKVSSDQFFSGNMNKQRTLLAFHNILSSLCSADEYMIEQNCFSVVPEHVFLNVSNCETALVCIPVITDKDINAEVVALFRKILFSTQFDSSEDASYITQLLTCINSGPTFNVYALNDLVSQLQSGTAASTGAPAPAVQAPPVQQSPAPATSFDSTISIDDMPAMMTQNQQAQKPPINNVAVPAQHPVVPNTPQTSVPQQLPVTQQKPPVIPTAGRPVNNVTSPVTPAVPKPPVQNRSGFAIPRQPGGAVAKEPVPPKPHVQNQPAVQADGEKKMSFFGLLAHYNKENVELYKRQKEAKKSKGSASAVSGVSPQQPSGNRPCAIPGAPAQRSPLGGQPMNGAPSQPYATPQYQPPVQPVPVQNSFNETTVLGPIGGETTVLSGAPGVVEPYLTRVKTGERISLNKPVFRIGKEKSYVDYFIPDNTAISRSHANIHTENGEYFIEDTNSTNHTYINGKLINSNVKIKLTSGDKVRLANEDFIFSF